MARYQRQLGLVWLTFCLLAVAGCGSKPELGSGRITLQLNWIPDAQHGGFYAAKELGYYTEEGFDVVLLPGGPGTPVIPKLTMGRCDFAIGNADQVLLARQQEADIVGVFAAMQNSPRCIMVHQGAGIDSLQQLKQVGTLALGHGKAFAEHLKRHVDLEGVRIVAYSGSVAQFLNDQDFAQQAYVFSEPLVVEANGRDVNVLMVSETGFNPYCSMVMTRRDLCEQQPELVRRFVRATRRGWESYLQDPTVTNAAIMKENPEMDSGILLKSVEMIRPLCIAGEDRVLGTMELQRWQTLRDQLIELKMLPDTTPDADSAFVQFNDNVR